MSSVASSPLKRRRVVRGIAWGAGGGVLTLALILGGTWRFPINARAGQSLVDDTRATTPVPARRVRLGMFNIASCQGMDGKTDVGRVADLLRANACDWVGLNEVRGHFTGPPPDQADDLGDRLGMASLFAPTERVRFHDNFGNGLLTRLDVLDWRTTPLANSRRVGYRNVLTSHLPLADGRTLTLLVVHVDRSHDRAAQLGIVARLFLDTPVPCVLMGDLNTRRNDPQLSALLRTPGVVDAVAKAPNDRFARIDWIFLRGLSATGAGVVDNVVSDHPFVWADVVVDPPTAATATSRPVTANDHSATSGRAAGP